MLPIIPISALQKGAAKILAGVSDYAVIQGHGHDRAFVLHPGLGRVLLESGMLEELRKMWKAKPASPRSEKNVEGQLRDLIGNVLRELSKR